MTARNVTGDNVGTATALRTGVISVVRNPGANPFGATATTSGVARTGGVNREITGGAGGAGANFGAGIADSNRGAGISAPFSRTNTPVTMMRITASTQNEAN